MELLNSTSQAESFQKEIEYYQNQQLILAQKTERYNEFLRKYYDELVAACKKSGIEITSLTHQSITSNREGDRNYQSSYSENSRLKLDFKGDFCGRNKPITKTWKTDYDKLRDKATKLEGYIKENFKPEGYEVRTDVNSHTLQVEEGKERRILLTIFIK